MRRGPVAGKRFRTYLAHPEPAGALAGKSSRPALASVVANRYFSLQENWNEVRIPLVGHQYLWVLYFPVWGRLRVPGRSGRIALKRSPTTIMTLSHLKYLLTDSRFSWFARALPSLERAEAMFLARDYTMTPFERCRALWETARSALRQNVPGAFVECGVWRGG